MYRPTSRCLLLAVLLVVGVAVEVAAQASGGAQHSVVVASDGTVWAWGGNGYGQLGDGTTTAKKVPTQVPGLTGIVAAAAGASHTLALGADGFVWAWGSNNDGQLGDGTTTQRTSPVSVPLASIVAVAAGDGHSVALAEDGTVWVWGRNDFPYNARTGRPIARKSFSFIIFIVVCSAGWIARGLLLTGGLQVRVLPEEPAPKTFRINGLRI